jgi:hypothetical protein
VRALPVSGRPREYDLAVTFPTESPDPDGYASVTLSLIGIVE